MFIISWYTYYHVSLCAFLHFKVNLSLKQISSFHRWLDVSRARVSRLVYIQIYRIQRHINYTGPPPASLTDYRQGLGWDALFTRGWWLLLRSFIPGAVRDPPPGINQKSTWCLHKSLYLCFFPIRWSVLVQVFCIRFLNLETFEAVA